MSRTTVARSGPLLATFSGALLLALPRCPLCFAAYCGALSAFGVDAASTWWLSRGVGAVGLFASWLVVAVLAGRRRDLLSLVSSTIAVLFTASVLLLELSRALVFAGAFAVFAAAWQNAVRCSLAKRGARATACSDQHSAFVCSPRRWRRS